MSENPKVFSVRDLLSVEHGRYRIPAYQRNYDWGVDEITQLIRDVLDCQRRGNPRYYIGTLVVDGPQRDGAYEVIDGQQRLITVTLLALYLKKRWRKEGAFGWYREINLDFESRDAARVALCRLGEDFADRPAEGERDAIAHIGIRHGYKIIEDEWRMCFSEGSKSKGTCEAEVIHYLFNEAYIARVAVPEKTDLNRYFEIMNSRGVQLERHEIVKTRMMAVLEEDDRPCFAAIWEACGNMHRYVQTAFSATEAQDEDSIRTKIFGRKWDELTDAGFDKVKSALSCLNNECPKSRGQNIAEILARTRAAPADMRAAPGSGYAMESVPAVVDFPNFLLQVLGLIQGLSGGKRVALDDKVLTDEFDRHLISRQNPGAIKEFAGALLQCRVLLDRYVIKRDNSVSRGGWCLERLHYGAKGSQYMNTFEADDEEEYVNHQLVMLMSALHVSFPGHTEKYWLNAALKFLYQNQDVSGKAYLEYMEWIAAAFVFEKYLAEDGGPQYHDLIFDSDRKRPARPEAIPTTLLTYGRIQNRFVFNYLDYCLWKRERTNSTVSPKIMAFRFTYRGSIEHFFPQNPNVQEDQGPWVHSFGNLCLMGLSRNATLSNRQPDEKWQYFCKQQELDSIKLYLMVREMGDPEEPDSGRMRWDRKAACRHEADMCEVLLKSWRPKPA